MTNYAYAMKDKSESGMCVLHLNKITFWQALYC